MTPASASASVDTISLDRAKGSLRNFNTRFLGTSGSCMLNFEFMAPPVLELGAKKGQFGVFSHM